MPDFVLVHGGSHGAWCWERLVPHLAADPRVGRVVATDLCGHGARLAARPQDEIGLDDYVASVLEDLETHRMDDVVLVGHSLAGITIPAVAHRVPGRIRHLVYLTTTNPKRGTSALDSMDDPRSPVARGLDVVKGFCSDLDVATSDWLVSNLGPQPPGPMQTPIDLVRGPEGIPQTYVLCEHDEILPADYQLEQAETIGADRIVRFASGHSPFASRPADLARTLLDLI